MKKYFIWSVFLFIVISIILYLLGVWNLEYCTMNNIKRIISISFLEITVAIVSWIIPYLIMDNQSASKVEIIAKVISKKADDSWRFVVFMPTFRNETLYSIFVLADNNKNYECSCNEIEFEEIKEGDTVSFIQDIRKSGSIYCYIKR